MTSLQPYLCLALFLAFSMATEAVAQVPIGVVQQGRLLSQDGLPVTEPVEVEFLIYNSETDGELIWSGMQQTQPDETGFYYTSIGDDPANPIDAAVLRDGAAFLTISVEGGEEMAPRQRLLSVPYATIAGEVADGTITADKLAPGFALDSSQVPAPDWNNVTGVPAGIADGDDDTLAGISCQYGEVVGWDGANWVCAAVLPATTDALGKLSCTDGQSPFYTGGTWGCTTYNFVDTNTTYVAGQNLALTGNRFDVMDGPGSGLDADTLDGFEGDAFLRRSGGDMTGNLRTVVTRVTKAKSGVVTNQTSLRSQSRLHVVNMERMATVDIPHAQFVELCGDFDGCSFVIGMRRWDNDAKTQMASRGPYHLDYTPTTGRWRASTDIEGIDGDDVEQHVHGIWNCCFLSEHPHQLGTAQQDWNRQMFLLNWSNATCPIAGNLECSITFDD